MERALSWRAAAVVVALLPACGGEKTPANEVSAPVPGPPASQGGATSPASGGAPAPTNTSYAPSLDPLVNPTSLLQSHDLAQATESEWLICTLDGNPTSLNPLFGSSTYEFILNDALYEGLFSFDAKMEWKVNETMVESVTESEDHKVWTVKMRPGRTWHDGHPFTAHDVAFSWKEILDERVPCPAQKSGTDEIELCEAVDDLTVRFVHKEPLPTSKWNVLFSIIPKHVFEKGLAEDPTLKTSAYYSKLNRAPVGSGAYRFVEWKENEKIVVERWEAYPGPKPHFQRIIYRIVPDQNIQLLRFEGGETDETNLSSKQFAVDTVQSEKFRKVGVKAKHAEWGLAYICWNMDGSNPFFKEKAVRRAMAHACNIPLMIDRLAYNLPTQARGMFHPDSWMYNPDTQLIPFDLAAAEKLLDGAGWLKSDDDGWRYKDGVRFSFTFLMPQGNPVAVDIAAIFQSDLKKIGVDMTTQVMEWATFQEKIRKHEFQSQIAGWGTGVDPDTTWNIWHSESYTKGRNYGGFKNDRVDELYRLGRKEFDHTQRARIYQEIAKILYEEQPYVFLWNRPTLRAFNKRIRGVTFSPRGVWNFDPSFTAWWVHKSEQLYNVK